MVIRRSPIVIVKDFVAVEVVAGLLYLAVGFLAHYAQIYRALPLSQVLSYQIAQALFLFFVQTLIIIFIFFRWHRETFDIKDKKFIWRSGLLWRHETTFPLVSLQNISYIQGPMGRQANYGTLVLQDFTGHSTQLRHIPEVQELVGELQAVKDGRDYISKTAPPKLDPQTILSSQENEGLEFKSTFRWDVRAGKVNKDLEKAAMKTVAALMNSRGGHLVVGIDDTKKVIGLESDYASLRKPDSDGFENHFSNIFQAMLGAEHRHLVQVSHHNIQDKTCAVIAVAPSQRPIYLRDGEQEEFYIRTGNGTSSLKLSQATAYIENRFKK